MHKKPYFYDIQFSRKMQTKKISYPVQRKNCLKRENWYLHMFSDEDGHNIHHLYPDMRARTAEWQHIMRSVKSYLKGFIYKIAILTMLLQCVHSSFYCTRMHPWICAVAVTILKIFLRKHGANINAHVFIKVFVFFHRIWRYSFLLHFYWQKWAIEVYRVFQNWIINFKRP